VAVVDATDTLSVAELVPPGVRDRLPDAKTAVIPGGVAGDSVTVPLNPLRLFTAIVESSDPPWAIVRADGEANTPKSGKNVVGPVTSTER